MIENYGTGNKQKVVYDLISFMFFDPRRRSKLTLIYDCVLNISEWSQKLILEGLRLRIFLVCSTRSFENEDTAEELE